MSVNSATLLASTTTNLETFTGRVSDTWGDWGIAHFTTYTNPEAEAIIKDLEQALQKKRHLKSRNRILSTTGKGSTG